MQHWELQPTTSIHYPLLQTSVHSQFQTQLGVFSVFRRLSHTVSRLPQTHSTFILPPPFFPHFPRLTWLDFMTVDR